MLLWSIIYSPEYINGKSELIGKPFAMTFVPEVRPDLPLHRRLADARGRSEYESVHIRKDGGAFPVFAHLGHDYGLSKAK
jgi:hypothetical protein